MDSGFCRNDREMCPWIYYGVINILCLLLANAIGLFLLAVNRTERQTAVSGGLRDSRKTFVVTTDSLAGAKEWPAMTISLNLSAFALYGEYMKGKAGSLRAWNE